MDINTIKTLINAYIHKNGVQAITGDILNGVLLKMVDFDQESVADLRSSVRDALEELDRRKPDRSDIDEVMRHIFDEVERIYETKADASATKSELLAIIATLATETQLQETAADLNNNILAETDRATSAEQDLSARIDTIVQGRNVRDIVANYDELLAYDTSTLGDNDIIMVLLDATKSGHTTYYRWNLGMQEWEFIGGIAFTYTKTEIDQKFAALHIVLPTFDAESSQEVLAQVDTMVRGAGADASFKVAIPVDDLSGNLDVTYVKSNPANLYLGVFADDRSVLYHITRTISQPRTYTCEVITKTFVEVSDFESEVTRIEAEIATKQPILASGENIKTINGNSLLGAGNLEIKGGDNTKTLNLFARAMADLNVSAPLLDRVTANGETIKEDSIAVVKAIKGKSLVWNQWARYIGKTENGITWTDNGDGSYTANGTSIGTSAININLAVEMIIGHTYLLKGCPKGGSDSTYRIRLTSGNISDLGEGIIWKDSYLADAQLQILTGTTVNNLVFRPLLIDLTQMFGDGNEPTTYEDFLARKPKVADEFAFNEGEIVNTHADGIASYDVDGNLLDTLDLSWIKDIKDEDGNLLFPEGLAGGVDIYDEVELTKAVAIGARVDLGSLTWIKTIYNNEFTCFFADYTPASNTANFGVLPGYEFVGSPYYMNLRDKTISTRSAYFWGTHTNRIIIRDDSFTDAESLKQAMAGVQFLYARATPIEVSYDEKQAFYAVANGGRESLITDGESTPADTIIGYKK